MLTCSVQALITIAVDLARVSIASDSTMMNKTQVASQYGCYSNISNRCVLRKQLFAVYARSYSSSLVRDKVLPVDRLDECVAHKRASECTSHHVQRRVVQRDRRVDGAWRAQLEKSWQSDSLGLDECLGRGAEEVMMSMLSVQETERNG